MEQWKKFELDCVDYLNSTYGNYFEHLGFSDSTTSDIRYSKEKNTFFVEAKMASAQSGQFVVLNDSKQEIFTFSHRNKSELDEHAATIIRHMNENYENYKQVGTAGINIDLPVDVFSGWIINMYKSMGVEFLITKAEDYIIFPIDKFSEYFDITAVYREKKSGSSRVPKSREKEVSDYLSDANIDFNIVEDFKIQSESNLDDYKFEIESYTYMLREDTEDIYKVRRLSNTRNANVIFSIYLKKNQDDEDLNIFKSRL